jgi:hypothetical protein
MKANPGAVMKRITCRVAAWFALSLLGTATLGPRVAPTLDATLADLTELCAPAPSGGATAPRPKDRTPLWIPRCGVA